MRFNSTQYNESALNIGLLIFRIFIGVAMISHGLPKLNTLMAGGNIEFMSFLGLSPATTMVLVIFSELVCSFFIILGLFTRLALIPLIITMIIAVFVVHLPMGFKEMEIGSLYLVSYILLMCSGSGYFSVDGMMTKRKEKSSW